MIQQTVAFDAGDPSQSVSCKRFPISFARLQFGAPYVGGTNSVPEGQFCRSALACFPFTRCHFSRVDIGLAVEPAHNFMPIKTDVSPHRFRWNRVLAPRPLFLINPR